MRRSGLPFHTVSSFAVLTFLGACASPVVKTAGFDTEVMSRLPLPAGSLSGPAAGERVLQPGPHWLATDAKAHLTFGRYRPEKGPTQFCLVLECNPETNRLRLLPLKEAETPLEALGSKERRAELKAAVHQEAPVEGELSLELDEVFQKGQLASPLPLPKRILAAAANFPSHLETDLDIPRSLHGEIAKTPPRLFQKYPPVPPPGTTLDPDYPFTGVIGPFDSLRYPESIQLPNDESGKSHRVTANLDYEAEVGVVLGRSLTWEEVVRASDEELREAVAGYVLISDVKARNPQVFERALSRNDHPDRWSRPYLTGNEGIDLMLGNWDESTCAWWGYAASLGELVAIGPWFVAADDTPLVEDRGLVCARTYAAPGVRGLPVPEGRATDVYYLRQCSRVTEDKSHPDAMLWSVPEIIRAALDPASPLAYAEGARRLEAGSVIALGTPAGIVLTVADRTLYRLLDSFLFWWKAIDWHNGFFGKDQNLYLREGDKVFMWAQGLGCQVLPVHSVPHNPVESTRVATAAKGSEPQDQPAPAPAATSRSSVGGGQ